MNIVSALMLLFLAFFSQQALCTNPFCLHPFYEMATRDKQKLSPQKLPADMARFLEPIYISAMLEPEQKDTDVVIFTEFKKHIHKLVAKKIWYELSSWSRKKFYEQKIHAEQLALLELKIDDPASLIPSFAAKKMQEILKNPDSAFTYYTLEDLLQTILMPDLKPHSGFLLQNICTKLPPVEMVISQAEAKKNLALQLNMLNQENFLAFSRMLEHKFSQPSGLNSENMVLDLDFRKINQWITLNNILHNNAQDLKSTKQIVFLLVQKSSIFYQDNFKDRLKDFLEDQISRLTNLLDNNAKIINFFEQENMIVLKEFTFMHDVNYLRLPSMRTPDRPYYLLFSRPELIENLVNLQKMQWFMQNIQEQLLEQNIMHNYADFFKNYNNYYESLELTKTKIDIHLKTEIDKTICQTLGLVFPCFDKKKIARTHESQQAVNFFNHDLQKLSTQLSLHLETIADFILPFLEITPTNSRIFRYSNHIRQLVAKINKAISTNEEYLPDYNLLLKQLANFRYLLAQESYFNFIKQHTAYKIDPDDLSHMQDYIDQRISHLI